MKNQKITISLVFALLCCYSMACPSSLQLTIDNLHYPPGSNDDCPSATNHVESLTTSLLFKNRCKQELNLASVPE